MVPEDDLLEALEANPQLTGLVKRVTESELPWVVVSAEAVAAWEHRDPAGWAQVSAWLVAKGVTVVPI